ncbi:MAG: plasmid stabilization protein ParE [Hyphomicrobiales bacterium]|nr:MAG: plasmid stabilization protein ParE [Hyphomicrobiales bacterium]
MGFRLSRKADEDIINAYVEGVRDFGVVQAEKYHAELERVFQLLSDSPKLARERKEITPPVRIYPHGSHMIVYSLDEEDNVLIIRVRHGREDWINNPNE